MCKQWIPGPSFSGGSGLGTRLYVSLAAGRGVGRRQEKRAEEEKEQKERLERDGEGMGTVDPDWGNQSSVYEDEQ